MVRGILFGVAVLGAGCFGSAALGGPDWTETGLGAGHTLGTAEIITANPVHSISGTLSGSPFRGGETPDFEDMYRIYIADPITFSARTDGGDADGISNSVFNSRLWLFDGAGHGLVANDDTGDSSAPRATGSLLRFPANDGSAVIVPAPGFYFLAVSGSGRSCVSPAGMMFEFVAPTEISGPDGPGGQLQLGDWAGPGQVGGYVIALTGVAPAPGSGVVFVVGGLFAARRRRA